MKQLIESIPVLLVNRQNLRFLLAEYWGGLYKRIDENMEALETVLFEAPELIQKKPWMVGWFIGNDQFLIGLHPLMQLVTDAPGHDYLFNAVNERRFRVNKRLQQLAVTSGTPFKPLDKELKPTKSRRLYWLSALSTWKQKII